MKNVKKFWDRKQNIKNKQFKMKSYKITGFENVGITPTDFRFYFKSKKVKLNITENDILEILNSQIQQIKKKVKYSQKFHF